MFCALATIAPGYGLLMQVAQAQSPSSESRLSPTLGIGTSLSMSEDLGLSAAETEIALLLEEGARYEHAEGVVRDSVAAQRAYCRAIGWESRQIKLNLSYNFGNKQVKATRQRSTSNEDEKNRIN